MVMRLRLALHGTKNYKVYHIVAVQGKARRNARPAELLGKYDPHFHWDQKTKVVEWSIERIRYWLSVGAQPSKPVTKLLQLGNILPPQTKEQSKFPPAVQNTSTNQPA